MPSSPWNAERVTTLKTLWLNGSSAAEIAKALGGVSRNAVIGKVHRLGLSGRMEPSAPRRSRPDRPVAKAPRRPGPPKPPPPPAAPAVRRRAAPAEPVEAIARIFDATALTRRLCRWPVGDPKVPGFGFCGAAVLAQGPYCPGHHQAAYPPRLQVEPDRRCGRERRRAGGRIVG
ncbi:GcrA family cell cycle regulator [Caulobacter sp.]|uniref:GcrA family cell cycle regulator n=1 Tax=Caulobacter sp. TaxID=78 RepID=UPI0031E2B310